MTPLLCFITASVPGKEWMLHPKLTLLAHIHAHLAPGSVLPLHRLMWALAHGYVWEVVAEYGAKECAM